MNITKLRALLDQLEQQGVQECVCFDSEASCTVPLQVHMAKIDANGGLVDSDRQQLVEEQPYDRDTYLLAFHDEHFGWTDRYGTFDEFYAMMEKSRTDELALVREAKPVILFA